MKFNLLRRSGGGFSITGMKTHILLAVCAFTMALSQAAETVTVGGKQAVSAVQSTGSSKGLPEGFGAGFVIVGDQLFSSNSALSATFGVNDSSWIQAYFSVPSGNPLQYAIGGAYKISLDEAENVGFHFGPALTAGWSTQGSSGASNDFFLNVIGIAGIHFHFTDIPKLVFSMEGGPVLHIGSGRSNLTVTFLGVGATYYF